GPQPYSMLLPASLAFAYVFYGFEAAAVVSEETKNAQKEIPRSMILALLGAGFVTAFLEFALIRGVPNMVIASNATTVQNTIPYILQVHFPLFLWQGSAFISAFTGPLWSDCYAHLVCAFVHCLSFCGRCGSSGSGSDHL